MAAIRLTRRAGDETVIQLGPMPEGGEIKIKVVEPTRGDVVFDVDPGDQVRRVFVEEPLAKLDEKK